MQECAGVLWGCRFVVGWCVDCRVPWGAVVRWGSVWVSECGGVLCGCHGAVDAVWMPRGTVGCLEATARGARKAAD